MEKLTIILPSVREHLLERCISSLEDYEYPIQILAQKFHSIYPHEYHEDYLSTVKAFAKAIEVAPPSQYFLLIDDDFIFRKGYKDNLKHAIHAMDSDPSLGCIVFSDNKNIKSQNGRVDVERNRSLQKMSPSEIIGLRKESGIFIRSHLLKQSFEDTPFGEDFAKIVHCFLDGYDIGLLKVNITHDHNPLDPMGWKLLSETVFKEKNIKENNKHFYFRVLKDLGYVDGKGFTEIGLKIHEYNRRRNNTEFLNTKG